MQACLQTLRQATVQAIFKILEYKLYTSLQSTGKVLLQACV